MASTLQLLRKAAGYRSGREFAEAQGLSPDTYARWEAHPEGIPTRQAWGLADALGCSVDQVIGRRGTDERGPVQRAYDGLSEQSKRAASTYISFLSRLDQRAGRARREAEGARWERAAASYERAVQREIVARDDPDELARTATEEGMREAFGAYVSARQDAGATESLLSAYDALHGRLALLEFDRSAGCRGGGATED